MRLIAFISILILLTGMAQAATVTMDIYGTNISNAQSNITKTGNNSYNVTAWGEGDITKKLQADINGNASDTITFTVHNLTVNRVVEVKVNGTSYNAYQADSTGKISFSRTQSIRNQTYQIAPALQSGAGNYSGAWFWNTTYQNGNAIVDMGISTALPNVSLPASGVNNTYSNNFIGTVMRGTGYFQPTISSTGKDTGWKVEMLNDPTFGSVSYVLGIGVGYSGLGFDLYNGTSSQVEWVMQGGNLGIGDTTPTEGKLVVNGNIGFTGVTATASRITTGSYTGDATANRAIAHGLGITSKVVYINTANYITTVQGVNIYAVGAGNNVRTVTTADATNFYVGNSTLYAESANANGVAYTWTAFG